MNPSLPILKPLLLKTAFNRKVYLPVFAVLFCFINNVFAGVKPIHHDKGVPVATANIKRTVPEKSKMISAPTISYGGPYDYLAGTAITNVTPTSSGVASLAYNGTPVILGSGFSAPFGVAVDAAGNVYMAQTFAGTVSKIPAGGGTPTTVGSGFSSPEGVAVDAAGNVYVSDVGNNTVKKIIAGSNTIVSIGSGFSTPSGIAVDAAGNVYVADNGHNAVKKIPVGGGPTITLASSFNGPFSVAVDGNGNVYVTDTGNHAVDEIPAAGGSAITLSSAFTTPQGIAIDGAGNIYVADFDANSVQMIPKGGGSLVTLGSGFSEPIGLAIDGSGNLYVGDLGNDAVKKIVPIGGYFITPLLPAGLSFSSATGVISGTPTVVSPTKNYIATAYNGPGNASASLTLSVEALSISYNSPQTYTTGVPISHLNPTSKGVAAIGFGTTSTAASGFNGSTGVAVDASGNLYVADNGNNAVKKIPAGGGSPVTIGSGFLHPYAIALDAAGNVYVADAGNNAIKKIPFGGGSTVTIGSGFNNPQGVAVDAAGNVYVADRGNDAVKEIPVGGGSTVTLSNNFNSTVAIAIDATGNKYIADAVSNQVVMLLAAGGYPVIVASVNNPSGIAVDASGNVYVASHSTNSVYILVGGSGSPVLISTNFSYPVGLTTDALGNVYGADQTAGTVQKITPAGGYYISNQLTAGLSFNSNTGVLSGTPTASSSLYGYNVLAYNSYGYNYSTIYLIIDAPAAPAVSYASPQSLAINTNIPAITPTSSGVAPPAYSSSTTNVGSGFVKPDGVAVDKAGNVYVVQSSLFNVTVVPAGGGSQFNIGSGFVNPSGMAVDAAGNVYVADFSNNQVKKIPAGNGTPVTIGTGFSGPTGVAVDASGNVYVADFNNSAIKEIQAVDGSTIVIGSSFNHPYSVAVDAAGNVYVSDTFNAQVKEIPAGNGTPVAIGSGIADPYGLSVDAAGNVFVADRNGNAVREILAGGNTTIMVGSGFINPYGVAIDGKGNLYVADYSNNAIRKIAPVGGYYLSAPLPTGLTFNGHTGTIAGKPTVLTAPTNYTVTAYNYGGNTQATVNLKVVSSIATLANLQLITATLSPAFGSGITNYTATVPNGTTAISVQPTANFPSASIAINGFNVPNGSVSDGIALNIGPNTITIIVTAEDGATTKTYTVTVTRQSLTNADLSAFKTNKGILTPAFSPGITSYTANVVNGVNSFTITPTTSDPAATVKVNGTAVTSGTASGNITISVGTHVINTKVTAADGVTTKVYTLTITRAQSSNANLSLLQLSAGTLSPVFAPATNTYTTTVVNGVSAVTVKPVVVSPVATVKVNGVTVASGSKSGSIALNVGTNVITTVITAQDGVTQRTYTVTVTRQPSINANLLQLQLSAGILSPTFTNSTTSYTASVVNSAVSETVTPTAVEGTATIKVNGVAVASGTPSGPIALALGNNTITTVVTAGDGVTKKTFTVVVNRAGPINIPDESVAVAAPIEKPSIEDDVIIVHQGISPNGDGINDYLMIDGIQAYPDNKLAIINRNGTLVYEAKGYDNASKVFDGRSSKTGQMQLPGTYFYQLDYTVNGVIKHKIGYLVLKY